MWVPGLFIPLFRSFQMATKVRVFLSLLMTILVLGLLPGCGESSKPQAPDPATTRAEEPEAPPAARLSRDIAPTHYRLHLEIDPRRATFSGTAEIDIELKKSTASMWLHGNDLNVSMARAVLADGHSIELGWEQASPAGVVKLTAEQAIPAGAAQLQFEYSAPFNTNLEGLYKVEQGADSYAFTQFEATSARLAFPSFDEPGFKVKFDISLTVPAQYSAVTNTPQLSSSAATEDRKTLTFATTKPLPTYLVAFAVGPFDMVEWDPIPSSTLRAEPLPLRGLTTRGKGDEIRFALRETAAIVLEMEDYFDTPYPYAKLDILAVPDFGSGAMENAGAITYREQLILLDENASVNQKRGFFTTHAHELAHQWFGNLVTPQWWDDIWLNESFATWNASIILDRLFPDQKYRNALQNSASAVMRNDSLASARQIREPIERHEDIGSAFNGITYQKGGGVLSMFEAFLGRDNFRDGIRHYMKTFAFGNTTAADFIGAIADANPQVNGEDLRAAFSSYIEQPGLPVIHSEFQCTGDGVKLKASQQRYLPVGSEGDKVQTWVVPVCVSTMNTGQTSSQCFLLKDQSQTVALNVERCPDSLLPNYGGTSYYRWSLPATQWQSLLGSFDQLGISEQISVANSLSAALNDGTMSLQDYLKAVPAITRSQSWRVAIAPRTDVYKIKEFLADPTEQQALENKLQQWIRPTLDALNKFDTLRPDQQQFRMLLMSTLALGADDPEIRKQLADSAVAYTGFGGDEQLHPDAIDPNIRYIALLVGIDEFGKPFSDLLWRYFKSNENALTRQFMLSAMAWSTDPIIAQQVRGLILSPELKDNEIRNIIYNQMDRQENRQAIWDWTRNNMDALMERIPSWRKGGVPGFFNGFCSRQQASDIEATFAPIIETLESGPRTLANTLETIRLCASFVEFHSKSRKDSAPGP
jgi:aminopeptidase N